MIKINLLEVDKERKTRKGGGGPAAPSGGPVPTSILLIGIIGLGVAGLAFNYIRYSSKLSDLETDVARMRVKKAELEPFIKKVDDLELRRNELAKKNEAIEQLRSQRTIPVHIMDEVSRALPDYLWLTNLSIKGSTLSIDGATLQEQAISSFMKSLEASEFVGACSLIETKELAPKAKAPASTTFKISAPITNPFKPPATEETTTTKTTTTKKRK
jgi:type IV pilus assembly protein PilN